MQSEVTFKFEPVYVTVLFLGVVLTAFACYTVLLGAPIWLICWPIVLGWIAIPKFSNLIKGIPAIALTDEYLVDNTRGFSIEWKDISWISTTKTARGPDAIAIKLNRPEKYINTPLKRIAHKIGKLYTSADILIYIGLISEKKESAYSTIYKYWIEHKG